MNPFSLFYPLVTRHQVAIQPIWLFPLVVLLGACPGDNPSDAGAAQDSGLFPSMDAGPLDAGLIHSGPSDAGDFNRIDGGSDAGVPIAEHTPTTDAGIAYWNQVDTDLNNAALVSALSNRLANDHLELEFDALYEAYLDTDTGRNGCAGIFDFYSSTCWDPNGNCGNYSAEGDCYNREHSWPKSWWGGSVNATQHQDLIAVIPADGYVNNVRGNLPLGNITNATYTSLNGSMRGPCVNSQMADECFEPAHHLKGDLARIYFYMAVRYEGQITCCDEAAVNAADIKPWAESQLRIWHQIDPVDIDEVVRNDRVQSWQGNRNPFVDLPQLVDQINDF